MAKVTKATVTKYVEDNIGSFHAARLQSLETLKLKKVIERKNPYLFKAKNIIACPDLVKAFLEAHLSSQEEALFGTFLEGLARFVAGEAFGGKKSAAEGIDLEFDRDGTTYIVAIKSGPNWGNSQQVKRMKDNFLKAKRILGTNTKKPKVEAINGCCYGCDSNPDKGDYQKLCGQRFWEFISGDAEFYIDIVEPIGYKAKERNEAFAVAYAKVFTKFTKEFIEEYCADGVIHWDRILKANSAAERPKKKSRVAKK